MLINAEFFCCTVPYQNGINILLRDSKSGGRFILRFFDGLLLFFLCGEGIG